MKVVVLAMTILLMVMVHCQFKLFQTDQIFAEGFFHGLSCSHGLQLLVLLQPGLQILKELISIFNIPGLSFGLQSIDKRLHVPGKPDGRPHVRPRLLHWDGVAPGQAAEDHYRCLRRQDDKRPEVDSSHLPPFHRCHPVPCRQRVGQAVEKRLGWRHRFEDIRLVKIYRLVFFSTS